MFTAPSYLFQMFPDVLDSGIICQLVAARGKTVLRDEDVNIPVLLLQPGQFAAKAFWVNLQQANYLIKNAWL